MHAAVTLVLPASIATRLTELADYHLETGGVLLTRLVETDAGQIRLLARRFIEVPDDAYEVREPDRLRITSAGWVPALADAERDGCVALWIHTHPGADSLTDPSPHDRKVNEQLAEPFRVRADTDYYGFLVIGATDGALRFTGQLTTNEQSIRIERVWVSGPRLALYRADDTDAEKIPAIYDRNIRAFGGAVQAVLRDLTVAVVGCGGTGSAVAEQLVRLGVRRLTLVDPDALSESNVTRVYGSRQRDVGRAKVDVLADHLEGVTPGLIVRRVQSMVTVQATARVILDADVVFGCTDDNAGRMVLSRLATFMMTPVIDCGVLLSTDGHQRLDGIHGRVTVLSPGEACLICRDRIDIARASSELLAPAERQRRVDEGYAQDLPGVEPAVVAYTTAVAAAAVAELLERLTHYGTDPVPSEVLLRLHDREMSFNNAAPRTHHYCDPVAGKVGFGMTDPFLEQTWQA